MSVFRELAEECRNAPQPDRELDAKLAIATGWVKTEDSPFGITYTCWKKDGKSQLDLVGPHYTGDPTDLPYFTASNDACILLVPEGAAWTILTEPDLHGAGEVFDGVNLTQVSQSINPALALCAAAMELHHLHHETLTKLPVFHSAKRG